MIRARGGFREITALVMLLTWIVGNEVAARPPVKQLPAGYEEWRATGVHPKILEPHAERGGGKAIFPTPRGDIATFYLSFNTPEKSRALLRCVAEREDTIPLESSLATGAMGYKFNVRQGEVIPLYGHLYAIDAVAGPVFVRLTRVTERVPEDLRPIKNSRLIATTTVRPELFWQQDAARRDRRDYDEVRFLKLDKDTRRATIELLPGFVSWKSYGPSDRGRLTIEVGIGDLLSARGRAYRVLNIVPEQKIPEVGRLVGWIELSVDPVTPTEASTKPPEAP